MFSDSNLLRPEKTLPILQLSRFPIFPDLFLRTSQARLFTLTQTATARLTQEITRLAEPEQSLFSARALRRPEAPAPLIRAFSEAQVRAEGRLKAASHLQADSKAEALTRAAEQTVELTWNPYFFANLQRFGTEWR